MVHEPVHKRKFQVFLSHATTDKETFVSELRTWLAEIAEILVWYDEDNIYAGNNLFELIGKGIPECRSMVLILSSASVKSGWVKREYEFAENHRISHSDFKIIPVLINDCEIPPFLQSSLYLDARNSPLTDDFYKKLLRALYPFDPSVGSRNTRDIFVSRSWHNNQKKFADRICQRFIRFGSGFRLIGDSKDQHNYNSQDGETGKRRVEKIISSCGGLLAILPYRENAPDSHYTSKYCLGEIAIASKFDLPAIVIAEPGVELPDSLRESVAYFRQAETTNEVDDNLIEDAVESMREEGKEIHDGNYVFFATNCDNPERNQTACQLIQQVTGMHCVISKDFQSGTRSSIQETITDLIRRASLVIADISQDNIEPLIEAGIAIGANVEYRIITCKNLPLMFSNKGVKPYVDDIDRLGHIHRLIYPFRRRILNYELKDTL